MTNIKVLKRTPLSPEQLQSFYRSIVDDELKVVFMNNIGDSETIQTLFDRNHFVLYIPVNSETDGHFISMFRNKNGIYFNDSYAHTPKEIYDNIMAMGRVTLDKKLFNLLRDSGENVYCNRVLYQTLSSEVSNCGRYAVACCLWNYEYNGIDFDLDKYHQHLLQFMRQHDYKDYDNAIVKITEHLV